MFWLHDFGLVGQWNVEVLCFLFHIFLIPFLIFQLSLFLVGGVSCCLQHCAVLGGDLKYVFNSCVTEKPLSSYLTRKWKYTLNSSNCLEPDSCIRWISIWRRSLKCSMTVDSFSDRRFCTVMLYIEEGSFIFNNIHQVCLSHLASSECKHQPCFSFTSVLAITEHQTSVVSHVLSDCF